MEYVKVRPNCRSKMKGAVGASEGEKGEKLGHFACTRERAKIYLVQVCSIKMVIMM